MPPTAAAVHRFEVHPAEPDDPRAAQALATARSVSPAIGSVRVARVYLIGGPLGDDQLGAIGQRLLTDPVAELCVRGASEAGGRDVVEVHPLPGVMDPTAASVRDAVLDLVGERVDVSTGWRYEFGGIDPAEARRVVESLFANPAVHAIHDGAFFPDELPRGHRYELSLAHVPLRDLDDAALERLSRDAHLFLSPDEMRAIRDEYRRLGREPTDIELETLAQTWSEHCVHKTMKSRIRYREDTEARRGGGTEREETKRRRDRETKWRIDWASRPGHTVNADGSVTIDNLLKSTVAAATRELIADGVDWTLSVFVDNAGIIRFDDDHAVCVKVETHNHPSAIEPYGGAATGIGGCIRDVIGTGLAAKPIASTDVFCVANPDAAVPAGCLPPHRVLTNVVAGVRDYGNRMGIPTVNGAVWFDDRYVGNPLVFCGSIGLMPADMTHGDAKPGDLIVALGGRTGRDGIHGATFSSAELTDTHADEFSHAVQIGNAIEEKRVLDAILRARDHVPDEAQGARHGAQSPHCPLPIAHCLFSAITDCGAGGFSSAIGEMGEKIGAEVHLERAPLKYAGLSYTEIWISEAQERMVLAVPPGNLAALQRICNEEHVELAVLGTFGTPQRELILNYDSTEVGRLPMAFLHDGIPTPQREATWTPRPSSSLRRSVAPSLPSIRDALLALLAHPNIASKHWIIRQYDHEVQGRTVVKPLVGPLGRGPGDAAVIEPVPGSGQGLAIACGLATNLGDPEHGGDPYDMALGAIDECVRNLVCVGADPDRIAILDNFCWPSCAKPENLGSLVRAAEGCYDGAKAYRTPFISGKDSLNNQFTTDDGRTIEIPPTLLITGVGIVPTLDRAVTMDAKRAGNSLIHVETRIKRPGALWNEQLARLGGSHFLDLFGAPPGANPHMPTWDPWAGARLARAIAELIRSGDIVSAHDISDGGLMCAVAEMLLAGTSKGHNIGCGLTTNPDANWPFGTGYWFGERPTGFVLECSDPIATLAKLVRACGDTADGNIITTLDDSGELRAGSEAIPVEDLARAWLGTLDW